MASRRILCLCGSVLSRDERDHYIYQCTICVMHEHELLGAHGRGHDHDEIDRLFSGPVDLGLAQASKKRRDTKAAA